MTDNPANTGQVTGSLVTAGPVTGSQANTGPVTGNPVTGSRVARRMPGRMAR